MNIVYYEAILINLLTITDYRGDKNQYVLDFIKACSTIALGNIIDTIPVEKQEEMKKKVQEAKKLEEIGRIFKENISEEEYKNTFKTVFKEELQKSLKNVIPVLSEEKRKEVENYLERINPN